jgi:hypothetical protein
VAKASTVFIIASNENRNGKTLLARVLADYLLLDGRDPFLIDTDAANPTLRNFFPGRTHLADLTHVQGQIRIFDRILASTGRDYVIDLSAAHLDGFFRQAEELQFFAETRKLGYRIAVLFIVDADDASARAARAVQRLKGIDQFIPVHNHFIGTSWPNLDNMFDIPSVDQELLAIVSNRRFSLRAFILGDPQNLPEEMDKPLKQFLYSVMQGLSDAEADLSLQKLRG